MASWRDTIKSEESKPSSWKDTIKKIEHEPAYLSDNFTNLGRPESYDNVDLAGTVLGISEEDKKDPLMLDPLYAASKVIKDSPLATYPRQTVQGLTFNTSDELIGSTMDALGGDGTNKKQLQQQMKLDVEQNPITSSLGQIQGNIGFGGAISKIPKVGAALSGAEILQKASTPVKLAANTALTTAQGIPSAMASKYGASEKSGMEALDESIPTVLEMGLIPGTYLGFKGIANLPAAKDKVIQKLEEKFGGDYYKRAKELAANGIETKGADNLNVLAQQAEDASGQVRKELEGTFRDSNELSKAAKARQDEQLADLLARKQKLEEAFKKDQDLAKQMQLADNEKTLKELELKRAKLGEQTENFLDQSRKKISNAYNDIDKELETSNFTFNNSEGPVANFIREVDSNPNLTEESKKQVLKALEPFGNETLDIAQFRKLKDTLNKLSSNKDYEVAGLAKKTYGSINQDLVSQLDSQALPHISEKLKKVNDQYSAFRRYDDNFTGKGYDAKDLTDSPTLRNLKQFGGDTAEDIQKTKDMTGLLSRINPEEAPAQLQQMGQFSSELKNAKNFTPSVPQENSKLKQLQDLIAKVQGKNTNISMSPNQQVSEDVFGQLNSNKLASTKQMNTDLEKLKLAQIDRNTGENLLNKVENNPEVNKQLLTEQYVKAGGNSDTLENASKAVKNLDVSRMVNQGWLSKAKELPLFPSTDPSMVAQQGTKAVQRLYGGKEAIAANIGRFAGEVSRNPGMIAQFYDTVSAPLGNVLRKIAEEPNAQRRAALIFAMMDDKNHRAELIKAGAYTDEDSGR